MSWSIDVTGRPEKVAAALEAHREELGDTQSGREYRAAAPHLVGLVNRVFERRTSDPYTPLVRVKASGSGSHDADGAELSSSVTVSIEPVYTRLVGLFLAAILALSGGAARADSVTLSFGSLDGYSGSIGEYHWTEPDGSRWLADFNPAGAGVVGDGQWYTGSAGVSPQGEWSLDHETAAGKLSPVEWQSIQITWAPTQPFPADDDVDASLSLAGAPAGASWDWTVSEPGGNTGPQSTTESLGGTLADTVSLDGNAPVWQVTQIVIDFAPPPPPAGGGGGAVPEPASAIPAAIGAAGVLAAARRRRRGPA